MYRQSQEQSLHDTVISKIANAQTKYSVWTNPGSEKNMGVRLNGDTVYPDLILTKRETQTVELVIEVETDKTVSADSAISQWSQYANLGVPLWLVVPYDKLSLAKQLCSQFGINARFGYFTTGALGSISFSFVK